MHRVVGALSQTRLCHALCPTKRTVRQQRKIRKPTTPALAVVRECRACLFTATISASRAAVTSMIVVAGVRYFGSSLMRRTGRSLRTCHQRLKQPDLAPTSTKRLYCAKGLEGPHTPQLTGKYAP